VSRYPGIRGSIEITHFDFVLDEQNLLRIYPDTLDTTVVWLRINLCKIKELGGRAVYRAYACGEVAVYAVKTASPQGQ
jgi:hypothetical protein